jgi:rubredoxin
MAQYQCSVCGWVYDEELGFPDGGIAPGTKFEDLPETWFCPFCSAEKDKFERISG